MIIIAIIVSILFYTISIIFTTIMILWISILSNLASSDSCSRRIRPRRRLYMIIIINFICVDIIPIILILILILQRPDGFCSGAPSSVSCCSRCWRRTLDPLSLSPPPAAAYNICRSDRDILLRLCLSGAV